MMNWNLAVRLILLVSFASSTLAQKKEIKKNKLYDLVVDAGGTGDFTTVQAAFDAVPFNKETETKIFIKKGIYKEKLDLPQNKKHISIIGEDRETVVLTFDDYASKKNSLGQNIGTTGSSSFFLNGDDFKAENITFENSSGNVGQAVAVRIDGDKVVFYNCKFLGYQDTLYAHDSSSRQYYKSCYIEGATDFIFGASTAVFEDCEIFAKKGGTYITAANTTEGSAYGFVFMNCKLTSDSGASTYYLGRPWRNYAKTVFINCEMGIHIKPEGWHNWSKPEAEETAFYAEYQSKGAGGNTISRVSWSRVLSPAQFESYNLKTIFKDWIPEL
ncbi:pectinesterase family protein [Flavobacterium faecale]|uniref:pectinesterase family protein n=1 Tax=Flavobacterium faecale TaxID=1355330 RepID=UPI003AABB7A3